MELLLVLGVIRCGAIRAECLIYVRFCYSRGFFFFVLKLNVTIYCSCVPVKIILGCRVY